MTTEQRPTKQYHERQRSLTEHDIEDLLEAIEKRSGHVCRFKGVSDADFYESVKFFRSWNESLNNGKGIVGKTILVVLITFLMGATGWGIVALVSSKMKGQ
jgi:hypothetical protein